VLAEEPVTLLLESVHQFGMQQPAIRDQAEKLRQDWARRLAQSSGVYTQKGASVSPSIAAVGRRFGEIGPYLDEFTGLVSAMNLPDQPVLLVLDTFEEVQYRSRDFVQNLWVVLDELQKRLPSLRTVLAGRAPIQTFKTENLLLARLDGEAARGFLEAQGVPGDVAQLSPNRWVARRLR